MISEFCMNFHREKMKRTYLLYVTLFAIHTVIAQPDKQTPDDINGIEPPAIVTDKFKADHPKTDPLWRMEDDNFSAGYLDELTNTEKIVVYDRYGNIVKINNEVLRDAHPKGINDYYLKNHPDEKNYKVWSSEDAKGKKTFYTDHKTGILYFDEKGKYLGTKQDKTKAVPTYKVDPKHKNNKPK